MSFRKPNARLKNTLVCVGTLGSFGDVVQSKTEGSPYYMESVEIRPSGDGQKTKFRLLWAPEFFGSDFDPSGLDKGQTFVYKKNISSLDGPSLLEGLCGSAEEWENLQEAVTSLGTEPDADSVHEVLSTFLGNLGPVPFIYTMKQERKVDGTKENDKGETVKRYIAGEYYEVDEIQHLTEKNVKALVRRVEKNNERIEKAEKAGKEVPVKIIFKFDPVDFGIDVELPQQEPAWVG